MTDIAPDSPLKTTCLSRRIARTIAGGILIASVTTAAGCVVPLAPRSAPSLSDQRAAETDAEEPAGAPDAGQWTDRAVDPSSELSLLDLQRLARQRNPVVAEWAARVAAAEARGRQVRSLYWPTLRSAGQFLLLEDEVAFSDPVFGSIVVQDRRAYTQQTHLSYTVFDWGHRHFLHQARLQDEIGTRERRRRALQELEFHVARLYFGLFEARKDLEVAMASVESLTGALELARNLRRVGRANDADVLVVEANLERRSFTARQIEDLIANLQEDLARLLDLPQDTALRLREPAGLPEPSPPGLAGADRDAYWEGVALVARPELAALDAGHEALRELRSAELTEFLPKFQVFVAHEYSTTESAFRDPDLFSAGVSIGWELFGGGRTRALVDEYLARASELRAEHRLVVHSIHSDVRRALRSLHRARDGVGVAATVVKQAEENRDRVRSHFKNGRATGQELLEAENLLRTEQAKQNRARFEVFRAGARLRFACGLDAVTAGDATATDASEQEAKAPRDADAQQETKATE